MENRDRGIQFVDQVDEPAIGMKCHMPRPGAGGNLHKRRGVRLERSLLGIEPVEHDFVGAQVGGQRKAVRGVGLEAMGKRSGLPLRVQARSVVFIDASQRLQAAIRFDWQTGDGSAAVVGHQQRATAVIDARVARSLAAAGLLIELRKLAGLRLDFEGCGSPSILAAELVDLGNRIYHRQCGMPRKDEGFCILATTVGCVARPVAGSKRKKLMPSAVDLAPAGFV